MAEADHFPPPPSPPRGPTDGVRRALLVLAVLALAAAAPAAPQLGVPAPAATPTPAEEEAADPYGRETPHGCFFGFLRAVETGSYSNAAEYLQIPASLKPQREQIAREFQAVLDHRFFSTSLERISRAARGTVDEGLPPEVERVGEILGDQGKFDVLLVRRETPGALPIWLFSWETIRKRAGSTGS